MSAPSHEDGMAKLISQLQKVDVSPGTGQPKTLEEMDMTPAEIERLGNCMKDPKFMELFQEYADEISDPRHRKEYDDYLKQLEAEGDVETIGAEYELVHPEKEFALRVFDKSGSKMYVNICSASKGIEPPSSRVAPGEDENGLGTYWDIPFIVAAPHRERNAKGLFQCYDVIMHTDTCRRAHSQSRFMAIVVETALDGINERQGFV
jgi:dynein assembly factor 2